ncbi:MAG: RNA polymerase factor sigma-54 [Gammaproteobacteria bacterium]|nr:RNA polymerase factor sigma-54 [Gammaproteobacteria bacterium]
MRQSLQLRTSQQLAMTPQLQQAIRMLQLSTLELQIEIQQALDSNMMLEEELIDDFDEEAQLNNSAESSAMVEADPQEESPASAEQELASESGMLEKTADIPDELPVDSSWDDIYDAPISTTASTPLGDEPREFEQGDSSSESLQEHLLWQMRMANLSDEDIEIGETVIDAVDNDGFITTPVEELLEGLQAQGLEIEIEELMSVLHTIQQFDPPGIAACSLQESLLLQLRALPEVDDATQELIDATANLVVNHFELLANRDYAQLKRKLRLNDEQLHKLTHLIQSLNPRPGSQFSAEKPQYIIPDVFVTKKQGAWKVELNLDAAPKIRVNSTYANLIKDVKGGDSNTLKTHLQEARWFIKSLQSRNETLMKVSTSIVEHQQGFLEEGEVGMKAMVLADIAAELGMHESTISRTTTRKYMHTPRGIFELKYFFSSHVSTSSGGECSSTAIRAMIKQLISEEPAKKPLSDNKIASTLSEKGINVARRTIAKYREAMAIPPSNERKRLA